MGSQIIKIDSEPKILECFPVILELRTHLSEAQYIKQIQIQFNEGYQLWGLNVDQRIVSIIGFRTLNTLAWGKILYIDDFATLSTHKGKGYATQLMNWIISYANRDPQCDSIHLDTGHSRYQAHRLYLKHGFKITCHHLSLDLRSKSF